ncbi:conserved hypothetical protein [Histoplasma capsulatum var. duboisii H88]|uniref:Bul1 C-terminal domain-containing protein n=1 Tax=Ajellomyces capsulatus (strain H88) TaxID=544711 RepID=F0UC45_AJEC8|nr:conserved hypothetical protein [Histoplasma capsulatum var. duboisii H88]
MTGNSVSIQLDMSRNSHGPIFLNDSCVAGTVVVDSCNSAQFDSVRVILEGLLYVLACLLQPSLGALGFSPAASDLGDDQGTVRFPFQFTIPSHILIPKGGGASAIEMVHPLPPSLCIDAGSVVPPSIERNNFRGDCRITYTLHAYLMCDGRPTTGTFRHVMLFPTQEPQPPSCTSDFPGDYILSRSAVLRTGMLFRRRGLLSVETREPAPLEMSRGKSGASTTVNLTLRFRESREIRSACGSMPPATPAFGVVSLKLKQTTFISVEPQRRLPATRDLLTSTVMVKDTNIINEQSRKMKFSPWVRSRWKEEHQAQCAAQERQAWETKVTLVFTYSDDKRPVPTFSSALVSRRYSVRIALHMEGVYHRALELEVPLQIIYRGHGQVPLPNEGELGSSEPALSDETLMLPGESRSDTATPDDEQAPDYVR